MILAGLLLAGAPAPLRALEFVRDRMNDLVRRLDEGSIQELEAMVTPPATFAGQSLRMRVELFTTTATLVDLVALGDRSPLRVRLSREQWAALVRNLPLLRRVTATMERTLYQGAFEALSGGDLQTSRVLVGTANRALRDLPHPDLLVQALRVFAAGRLANLACHASLTGLLLERSARGDLDDEARDASKHLYVLHAATRATVEVHRARLARSLEA